MKFLLDVDERIFATVSFECFERFIYQIADVFTFLLAVFDSITQIRLKEKSPLWLLLFFFFFHSEYLQFQFLNKLKIGKICR